MNLSLINSIPDKGDSMDVDRYESVAADEGPGPLRCEFSVNVQMGTSC